MPKVGMEPKRRAALIAAVIEVIGETRSLEVTVAQIAKRAGMSTGLAHHYFGSKEQMLLAAMGHILKQFSRRVAVGLRGAQTPRERLDALIRANFEPRVFDPRKTSAWLSFYGLAQSQKDAGYLMSIYQKRLRSNLLYDLRRVSTDAETVADTMAALIDGVYLRAAIGQETHGEAAYQLVSEALESLVQRPLNRASQ